MSEDKKAIPTISMDEILSQQEDKTKITALLELLKLANIELITEYPTVKYTKEMVKLETWRESLGQVFHMKINHLFDKDSFANDEEKIVKTMCYQFMLKMTSHKRRRSQEIVNAVRNESALADVIPERNLGRNFLGMKRKI